MTKKEKRERLKEFNDLKSQYLDDEFLKSAFPNPIKRTQFIRKINNAVHGETYNVIGYGSLMKLTDARRTFAEISNFRNCKVEGFERIFNVGQLMRGAYLNVQRNENKSITAALITISDIDFLNFIYRETLYNMVKVKAVVSEDIDTEVDAYMVLMENPLELKANIEPMLTYVSLCIAGANELMSPNQFSTFLNETIIPSHYTNTSYSTTATTQSLFQWMEEFKLLNYLSTHIHTTR